MLPQNECVLLNLNFECRTALDLSGDDCRSLIGYPAHYGKNQQWIFVLFGEGYAIKSGSSGLYLIVDDALKDGVQIIATPFPISWKVEYNPIVEETIRIMWPSGKFILSLVDYGSRMKVQLMPNRPQEFSKWWRIHKVPNPRSVGVAGPITLTIPDTSDKPGDNLTPSDF